MKFNQLVVLGVTSAFVAALPISAFAMPTHTPAASVSQTGIAAVAERAIAQTSTALFTGMFVAGEAPTTGTAKIVTEGGHRYLELDAAFSTSSQGPDLHVLLEPTAQPPQTYSNQGSTINLGSLREYAGAQRYPIPDSINLANYQSIVIWCRMANATFGYAPLHSASSASIQ
jgi:Electron transfer DM13